MDKNRGFLKAIFTTLEIFNEVVHLNWCGVQKNVKIIRNYYQQHKISVSKTTLDCDKYSVFNESFDCASKCFLAANIEHFQINSFCIFT